MCVCEVGGGHCQSFLFGEYNLIIFVGDLCMPNSTFIVYLIIFD